MMNYRKAYFFKSLFLVLRISVVAFEEGAEHVYHGDSEEDGFHFDGFVEIFADV